MPLPCFTKTEDGCKLWITLQSESKLRGKSPETNPAKTSGRKTVKFSKACVVSAVTKIAPKYTAAFLAVAVSITGCIAPNARAQAVAVAEVDGHITDPTGQSIPGAAVKMIEVDRQQMHNTVTDATGRYALPNLPTGAYQLEVSSPGFKTYVQKGIVLQVASNIEIAVVMQIGAVTESIQVTANGGMVETKENSISQVIEERRIVDLPLNGRNLTQLLTLTGAGTTAPAGDLTGSKNMLGSNGSGTFSVAGGQANGVNYLLDGGDNNDAFSNVNLPIPFPDAVQEFSVQTNAVPAQYGLHPGGIVNIVTKSGSNGFHGDVFDFLRNYDLIALQKATPARDSLKRNQFGGVAGGRIRLSATGHRSVTGVPCASGDTPTAFCRSMMIGVIPSTSTA